MTRGRVGGLGTPGTSGERIPFFPPELNSCETMYKNENGNENENENTLQAMPMKEGKNRYANISPSPTDDNDTVKNALKNPFLVKKNNISIKDKNGNEILDQNLKNASNKSNGKISKTVLNTQFSTDCVEGNLGTLDEFDLHQLNDKVLQSDSVRQSEDLNDLNSDSTSFELCDNNNKNNNKNDIVININNNDIRGSNNSNNNDNDGYNDDNDNSTQSTNESSNDVKKFERGRVRKVSTGSARSSAERDDIIDLRNKRIDVVSTH